MSDIIPRSYTGGAATSAVVAAMSPTSPASGASFNITTATGWPSGDFIVAVIDRGLPSEETILIQSLSGTTCVLAPGGRGFDGTDPNSHVAGAVIEHSFDALAAQALVDHVNDTAPTEVHPFLMREADHDLALHDSMGLQTTANHTKKLHTDPPLSLLGQAEHDRPLHDAMGIMFEDEHTRPIHDAMGVLFEDEHTLAIHQDLGLMADSELTKARIDPLGVDAASIGGITKPKLKAYQGMSTFTGQFVAGWTTLVNSTANVYPYFINPPKPTPADAAAIYDITLSGHITFNNRESISSHIQYQLHFDADNTFVNTTMQTVLVGGGYQTVPIPTMNFEWTQAKFQKIEIGLKKLAGGATVDVLETMQLRVTVRPMIPPGA